MARKKQIQKAKEPIKVRCKQLANGNQSLYLDIYEGDGKPRVKEYLRLYLIPEKDTAAKIANANTMQAANAIKAERIIELANGKAGIETPSKANKIHLVDWMKDVVEKKQKSVSYRLAFDKTINHLIEYKGDGVLLSQIDKNFILGFIKYLDNYQSKKTGGKLSKNSKSGYFSMLGIALTIAARENIIPYNPILKLSREEKPEKEEGHREYLSVEEVKSLINTDCHNEQIKRAFLFSCFCGFRVSDIRALRWGDISKDGDQWRANIVMIKTGKELHQPLSAEAIKWLPERGAALLDDNVFSLPTIATIEKVLGHWAMESGIKKKITFHVSRHTFATLNLTAGVDIYTTSKLMGHSNVQTTQIYAKIIDQKKDDAINAVGNLFK